MTTIAARELRFTNAETVRCPGWEQPRELGCVSEDGDQVVIGVWPESDEQQDFDEFALQPDAEVEVDER